MPVQATLPDELKWSTLQTLQQRLAAARRLPDQVAAWRRHAEAQGALAQHQSQIDALQSFLTTLLALLTAQWNELQAAPDAVFLARAGDLQFLLRRVYGVWRFYKERFDQRLGTDEPYNRFLFVADEVAWSTYRAVIEQATYRQLVTDPLKFKQPPLLHLFDDPQNPSPVTRRRVRHAVIPGLPVHVIDLPYAETASAWGLLALHHEVAHGLVADWEIDLGRHVLTRAKEVDLAPTRLTWWFSWAEEIFADCLAILLAGPPFLRELMDVLVPLGAGKLGDPDKGLSPHPPPYLRIPLGAAFLRTLEAKRPRTAQEKPVTAADQHYRALADGAVATWQTLHAAVDATPFQPYLAEMEAVLTLLIDTALPQLQNHTARQLGAFTPAELRQITRVAKNHLVEGERAGEAITPRLTVSAARLAFDQLCSDGVDAATLAARVAALHESTLATVEANPAQQGTRALVPGEPAFLERLADAFARQARPEEETPWE